ncbi:unnamed protein product [Schistosoma rodhaini]|nr:unnamed protein product [Schistosoma rodhaini]
MQNDLKQNHDNIIHNSELCIDAWLSEVPSSSHTSPRSVWQVINPYFLPDELKIMAKGMKDIFGYDQVTLIQTFNRRKTCLL